MRAALLALPALLAITPALAGPKQNRVSDVYAQDIEMAQFVVHTAWLPNCSGVVINERLQKIHAEFYGVYGGSVDHDAFKGRYRAEIALSQSRTPAQRCAAAIEFLKPSGIIEPY